MRVCTRDWLGRHVFTLGEYEPATARVIAALLRPGGTFVDVGANAGYFSLLASRCVGPNGFVMAFEPVPSIRDDLMANIALNQASNIQIRTEALSNRVGNSEFYVGPVDHCGVSSLRMLPNSSRSLTVETRRLDDLLTEDARIDLIKIDVEGAEYLAMQGMWRLLERQQPDLVVEVTNDFLNDMGHSADQMCKALLNVGYQMHIIENMGLRQVSTINRLPEGQYNALFTVRSHIPSLHQ